MILVSACLAGVNCRYDGDNNKDKFVEKLVKEGRAVAICPEVLGGMAIPRIPCEIIFKDGEKNVYNKKGEDFTSEFKKGAKKTLKIAQAIGVDAAILKAKSPSCGLGRIYDGTFSDRLVEGNGLTAELLSKYGIKIYTEKQLDDFR